MTAGGPTDAAAGSGTEPRTGPGECGEDAEGAAATLAIRLREAHLRVAVLAMPTEQKGRVIRRLLALTDASKVDVVRAAGRLDALLADLDDPTAE